jgi:hypothetical protein
MQIGSTVVVEQDRRVFMRSGGRMVPARVRAGEAFKVTEKLGDGWYGIMVRRPSGRADRGDAVMSFFARLEDSPEAALN